MRLDTWALFAPKATARLHRLVGELTALKALHGINDEAKANDTTLPAADSVALLNDAIEVLTRLATENKGSAFLSGEVDDDGLFIRSEAAERLLAALDGGLYLGTLVPRDTLTRDMAECYMGAFADYPDHITLTQAIAAFRDSVTPDSKLLTQLETFFPLNVSSELTAILNKGVNAYLKTWTNLGSITDVIKGFTVISATHAEAYDTKCESYYRAHSAQHCDAANTLVKTRLLFLDFLRYRKTEALTSYADPAGFIAEFCNHFSLPATTDLHSLSLEDITKQFTTMIQALYAERDAFAAPHIEIETFRDELMTSRALNVAANFDPTTLQYTTPPLNDTRIDRMHGFVKAACNSDATISTYLTDLTGEPTAVTVTQDHYTSCFSAANHAESIERNLASIAALRHFLDTCYKSRPRGLRGIWASIDALKFSMIDDILNCLAALEATPLDKALIHRTVVTFHNVRFRHLMCVSQGKLSMGDMACSLLLAQSHIHDLMNSVNLSNDHQLHASVKANFIAAAAPSSDIEGEEWDFVAPLTLT